MNKRNTLAVFLLSTLLAGCAAGGEPGIQGGSITENENVITDLAQTDPELEEIRRNFMDEVNARGSLLDEKEKQLIAIVSLVTQQSEELLRQQAEEALEAGVLPVEIREAVYQCAPYTGFPRTMDALEIVDAVFAEKEISLPLEETGTVTEDTRFALGLDAQATIFGDGMRQAAQGGPETMDDSSYYLVTNCFGDYYTREGLELETRELLTLCILTNLGTESQIQSHIAGNANMGREKAFLEDAIYQCLPYAGYPRILNALNCLNAVLPEEKD